MSLRVALLVPFAFLALAVLAGCGSGGSPASSSPSSADSSAAATGSADSTARSAADRRALERASRLAARTDSIFETITPLSAGEKGRLRRHLQPQHIEQARRLGLDPVSDRRAAGRLAGASDSSAVRLSTNDFYIVDPAMSYAVPLVVPSTKHALQRLGRRFQRNLMKEGLPPYRFVLTNVLRTGQDQAAIRGYSVNAASGQSTHEYGTTFDIFYEWFHYAPTHDSLAAAHWTAPTDSAGARSSQSLNTRLLRQRLYAAYRRDGDVHARKIKAVLGRAILELQDEGLLLATYERQQPVFHLTVARRVEAPSGSFPQGNAARASG